MVNTQLMGKKTVNKPLKHKNRDTASVSKKGGHGIVRSVS